MKRIGAQKWSEKLHEIDTSIEMIRKLHDIVMGLKHKLTEDD